jgi:class 3 adenylate cyclase
VSETQALFDTLRQSADPGAVAAIERLIQTGEDRETNRINVLDFARKHGLDEEHTIAAFLHAAKLGIFELSWNVLCPGCGGVLDAGATLKTVRQEEYSCSLCAAGYEPTLDEMVEVAFTVTPRVRRIPAHDPSSLPMWEYMRQIYLGSGVDVPENFEEILDQVVLESIELQPGEKAVISLQLPQGLIVIIDPVTHGVQFLDVKGEPRTERLNLSMVFNKVHIPSSTMEVRPGSMRLAIENATDVRVLPSVWLVANELHDLLMRRKPFLTAKRLLTNQTFRDLYRTDTLAIDQRLKITSLTFLFTDLRGSTALYERVGDLNAYDLVKAHFRLIQEVAASEAGAIVKTIGDAVMATFPTPDRAVAAALRMREAMDKLNRERGHEDILLKIGIHEGPCLAVMLNDRQDYFGQTVNIASRVQNLAVSRAILATKPVVDYPETAKLLVHAGLKPAARHAALKGVHEEVRLYEIP